VLKRSSSSSEEVISERMVAETKPVSNAFLTPRSEHIARFLREARPTVGLEHPGIAMVYEAGQIDLHDGPRAFVALRR